MEVDSMKKIYIVVSQSGSFISKALKFFTKDEYNHVSISFSSNLDEMYSFGRRYAYYPFWSGLVLESRNNGTFKRFTNTKIVMLSYDITDEGYNIIHNKVNQMLEERTKYGYNYIGAFFSLLNIGFKTRKRYYCSEFVREMLASSNIENMTQLPKIIYPSQFLEIPDFKCVYKGKYSDYSS